ncbi:YIP1 family protein [Paenibacillus oralis]|uniref:YIP1 family protein n=1 Tax=Paenibacillus oralis TaxID=2490856 RepID=A0A3P3U0A8_9BACL|nr:Yip1 family protein [Paenibacillus oralis]RRJ63787.1 YIP1 family protein [Paenibacillus oralis]
MKNLFTVFVSPEATFKRVKESRTAWILPLIVLLVASVIVTYLQMPAMEGEMRKALQQQQLDPAMVETLMATTQVTSYVSVGVMSVAMIFVMALLLLLLNLIVRGEGKYMQFVSVASYAALPGIVGGLITGILIRVLDVQSVTDMSLSLGAFVADKSSQLYKLLSILDPFSIWSLILYVIGSAVMMQRPRKTIAIWITAVWLIFTLGSVLLV